MLQRSVKRKTPESENSSAKSAALTVKQHKNKVRDKK